MSAASSTFCNIPLTTSVDTSSDKSLLALEWILSSGIPAPQGTASGVLSLPYGDSVCSMQMKLSVCSSLPYDLVLGRDWLLFCRDTLPNGSFTLSSGVVQVGLSSSIIFLKLWSPAYSLRLSALASASSTQFSTTNNMDPMDVDNSETDTDDLQQIRRSLDLHAIPHVNLNLLQCRHLLIHHIATGTCADFDINSSTSPRPDRSACRALCQDFASPGMMSATVLNVILDADHKQISTDDLLHVASALNISVPGTRNRRFKLRAAIRKHIEAPYIAFICQKKLVSTLYGL
ncbi:hypothetical protein C8J57DRAFT_1254638 [Mycena rebaudengoi]|nr:hypothetical protein C8J57DRAFT_1254638 [Mycena rebaudengoi]